MDKYGLPKMESIERRIRRHEVTFSEIQGDHGPDYLDNYLAAHSAPYEMDIVDKMVRKIDKRVLQRCLTKLPDEDRTIFYKYLIGIPQNQIAESLNISPSAINQRLEKIIYNYRVILCNNKEWTQTSHWDLMQYDTEYLYMAYLKEIRNQKYIEIDIKQVKELIIETKKAITHTIMTKSNVSIRQQLSKKVNFSKLDDGYIQKMNNAFADLGIEAHFENLKKFDGAIFDMIKMVNKFIEDIDKLIPKGETIKIF